MFFIYLSSVFQKLIFLTHRVEEAKCCQIVLPYICCDT